MFKNKIFKDVSIISRMTRHHFLHQLNLPIIHQLILQLAKLYWRLYIEGYLNQTFWTWIKSENTLLPRKSLLKVKARSKKYMSDEKTSLNLLHMYKLIKHINIINLIGIFNTRLAKKYSSGLKTSQLYVHSKN